MRILLVDDHVSYCEGLTAALAATKPEFSISFVTSAVEAEHALREHQPYDLLITDLMLPGITGMELIKRMLQSPNPPPTMVMSSVVSAPIVRQALQLGVVGYMPKSYGINEIIDAIDDCIMGNIHVPPALLADNAAPMTIAGASRALELTSRQTQILQLMDRGCSNQEIAEALHISKATVKTHINQLFKALNVGSRVNCLRVARQSGLIMSPS